MNISCPIQAGEIGLFQGKVAHFAWPRLSRSTSRPASRPASLDSGRGARLRRAWRCRYRPAPGRRLCPPGRAWLVRQEYHVAQPTPRQLFLPGSTAAGRLPRTGPCSGKELLWILYCLSRCLPNACIRGAGRARFASVHQLPYNRAQGNDTPGIPRTDGKLAVRRTSARRSARGIARSPSHESQVSEPGPISRQSTCLSYSACPLPIFANDSAAPRDPAQAAWAPSQCRHHPGKPGQPDPPIPTLEKAAQDCEPLVREAALWAIEQIEARHRVPSG